MPPTVKRNIIGAAKDYGKPMVGRVDHVHQLAVNVAVLTTREVDIFGYLKPGVIFDKAGVLVGIAPAYNYGITIEATKVADGNTAPLLAAAGVKRVAVCRIGLVNGDIVEDNLGAVMSANELAGFERAGTHLALVM
jgi:hypothetical protein